MFRFINYHVNLEGWISFLYSLCITDNQLNERVIEFFTSILNSLAGVTVSKPLLYRLRHFVSRFGFLCKDVPRCLLAILINYWRIKQFFPSIERTRLEINETIKTITLDTFLCCCIVECSLRNKKIFKNNKMVGKFGKWGDKLDQPKRIYIWWNYDNIPPNNAIDFCKYYFQTYQNP